MKDSQNSKKKQKKFHKKTVRPVESPQTKSESGSKKHESWIKKFLLIRDSLFMIRKKQKDFLLLLIPLSLFLVFLVLDLVNTHFTQTIAKNQLTAFPVDSQINPYPFVQQIPLLPLSAKSALVMDADSSVILFAKNEQLRFSMASTTKIMTALTALDYFQNDSILTIQSIGVEGTGLGLQVGDQYTFEDLLYAMLLPSANDAAVAIADNYPGGRVAFVAKMNEKAQALHLINTHFADPAGLEDDGDYTTVIDLARLAAFAIQNETFAKAAGTKQKIITPLSKNKQFVLTNLNKLLGINGVTGIKTGTTEGAGEVLVTSSVLNSHTFIIVVMNSEQRFVDTEMLLQFITQNVQFINPGFPK